MHIDVRILQVSRVSSKVISKPVIYSPYLHGVISGFSRYNSNDVVEELFYQ